MSTPSPLEKEFWEKIGDEKLSSEQLKQWLTKNPSTANIKNSQGLSALVFFVFNNTEKLKVLLPFITEEDILKNALIFSIIKKPFDPEITDLILSQDLVKKNPKILGEAILKSIESHPEAYQHLIKKIDPALFERGKSAFLKKAIECDQVDVVQDLERRGISFTSKMLDYAIKIRSQKMINFLTHKLADQQKQHPDTILLMSELNKKLNHPISVGQALLILIDHYQRQKNDAKVKELKKLYLLGAENRDSFEKMQLALGEEILSPYFILADPTSIDNDPTRRYFETHLAFETLRNLIKSTDINELKQYYEMIFNALPEATKKNLTEALEGRYKIDPSNPFYSELSTCIAKVDTEPSFQTLLATNEAQKKMDPKEKKEMEAKLQVEKDKVKYLIRSIFLGVPMAWGSKEANPQSNYALPLAIYGFGIFSEIARGKQLKGSLKEKGEPEKFRSKHLGLMKRTMPVPFFDVAYAETPFGFVKPSDQASFLRGAEWVENNFNKMVHPFSNSISGTLLCQLRTLAYLQNVLPNHFKNKDGFIKLMKGLISPILYLSGGHTLYEFTAPLTIREVRNAFSFVKGFDDINLNTLFLEGNEQAFDQALKDTMLYNQTIINKKAVLKQLHSSPHFSSSRSLDENVVRSKHFIGALEQIDLTQLPINQSFLAKQGNEYYIIYKTDEQETGVNFYRLEATKDGIKINNHLFPASDKSHFDVLVDYLPKIINMVGKIAIKEEKESKEILSHYQAKSNLKKEEDQSTPKQKPPSPNP